MKEYTLITGATGGIGLEFARCCARDGCGLILVARNQDRLQRISDELVREHGIDVHPIAMDMAEEDAAAKLYQQVEQNGWVVENLINNVGFGDSNLYFDTSWARQKNMIDINIVTLMHLTYLFGDAMRRRQKGRILNVSSLASATAGPYMSVYYASKAFVSSFSEALHEELKPFGVSVTTLRPGPVATDFEKNAKLESSGMFRFLPVSNAVSVAQCGYKAMKSGKAVVSYGWATKIFFFFARILSRRCARRIALRMNQPSQPRKENQK